MAFSRIVALSRRSSNQTKRTCASIALTISSSSPFSMNEREDSTMRTLVVLHAAIRLNEPEVKLSIAATRPAACTAMNATAAPLALGSISATVSPGRVISAILRASRATPMRNRDALTSPESGSCTIARRLGRPRKSRPRSNA